MQRRSCRWPLSSGSKSIAESAEIEGAEINVRTPVDDPLRKRFANRRRVFEAMTRAR
jgi:hypothetical protein